MNRVLRLQKVICMPKKGFPCLHYYCDCRLNFKHFVPFTGLKVTNVNLTYHSKMEGHVIFTFTLFLIYQLGGEGWRSSGESGGQILLYIHFISDILAWRRGVEESRGIRWSDTPLYSHYFRYISLEERGGGVQGNQVVRYSSIFTLFQIYQLR